MSEGENMKDTGTINAGDGSNVWKGLAAGLIGGLIASWTMNRFQDLWSKLAKAAETQPNNRLQNVLDEVSEGGPESCGTQGWNSSTLEVQDDTTVRAASAVSEGLFGHKLTQSEKKLAGPAVHYILGTGVGGLYGAAAELAPNVTAGAGLPFGAAFWLVVDEGAVPLLGLLSRTDCIPAFDACLCTFIASRLWVDSGANEARAPQGLVNFCQLLATTPNREVCVDIETVFIF